MRLIANSPSPSQLLGVGNFDAWYPGQYAAFSAILRWYHSPARFLGVSAATGIGKTLLALLASRLSGADRTVILTATKGLMQQYLHDAASLGGVEVKGQNNFRCTLVPSLRADEGPCHEAMPCSHRRSGGCPYYAQLQSALDSRLVITNYAYYLAQRNHASGLGDISLLVCDEAHLIFPGAMDGFLSVQLSRLDIESLGLLFPNLPVDPDPTPKHAPRSPRKPKELPVPVVEGGDALVTALESPAAPDIWAIWRSWASCSVPLVEDHVRESESKIRDLRNSGSLVPSNLSRAYRTAKSVLARLSGLAAASGSWVVQRTPHGFMFTPRWVSGYGSSLFGDAPKVLLMSAVLSRKTLDTIGVPSDSSDRDWLEVPSYFPSQNTPVWHIPTARVDHRIDDYGTTIWLSRIDQIIQRRLDRKGIVFTVSYDRARLLLSRSRFKNIMFTHGTGDVTYVVNRFKAAKPPAVLVSPVVTTGWDFPMLSSGQGTPQYIIVGKVPWPDTRDPVSKARHEDDKDWGAYIAMGTVVQESGRCSREFGDKAEVFVVDDNWIWFYPRYKQFAPQYFRDRARGSLSCVPDPLF